MTRSGKLAHLLAWLDGARSTGARLGLMLLVAITFVPAVVAGNWLGVGVGEELAARLGSPLDQRGAITALLVVFGSTVVLISLCSGMLNPKPAEAREVPKGYVRCGHCKHTVMHRQCDAEEARSCAAMYTPHEDGSMPHRTARLEEALLVLYVDMAETAILAGGDAHERKSMREARDALAAAGLIDLGEDAQQTAGAGEKNA